MEMLREFFSLEEWKHWAPVFLASVHVLGIAIAAWVLLYKIVPRLIKQFRFYMSLKAQGTEEVKRVDTLGHVFHYTATVSIIAITGMLVLSEVGVSIAPLLGAAGVVGVAVGFGAQSLIKDYFTGLFLLLENQVRQGDMVEVAGKNGEVEEITLRYMRLRDFEGNVHYIPNGLITTVTNKSRDFAYAVVDIGIAYKEDVDGALEIMRAVGHELRNTPDFGPKILEDIELGGIESLGNSAVTLRGSIKTRPHSQWSVKREMLRRLKLAYETHGIEIPFPHMTIYLGQGKDGASPPLRVVSIPKAD
jgi:small conductance mechanosensitive channel